MILNGLTTAVTGGASGLGLATARRLVDQGGYVTIIDLPTSNGESIAAELGDHAQFMAADVLDADSFSVALEAADQQSKGLRGLVHCAGAGRRMRILEKDGTPGSLEDFEFVIRLNLVGSFNALRLGAAIMAKREAVAGERGAIVLTSSVAAYEGQIGQINYSAAKAGVVGMTLVAARDLGQKGIRVCAIAPGIMDTPLLGRLPEKIRDSLSDMVPNPKRLGSQDEFAMLAAQILENGYLNGETIRLDGAIRMAPR